MNPPRSTLRTEKTTATRTADPKLLTFTEGRNRVSASTVTVNTARCRRMCMGEAYPKTGPLAVKLGQAAVSFTSCVKRARAAAMRSRFSASSKA